MIINGVTVADPTYRGVTEIEAPIWADNKTRSINGKSIGDIKAIKSTIEIEWSYLTYDDFETLRAAVIDGMAGGFFSITYPATAKQGTTTILTTKTKTVEADKLPRTFYSPNPNVKLYEGIKITFTEQ